MGIAAIWYADFISLIDRHAVNKQAYDNIKKQVFSQAVKIIESTLLTKQHCIIDVALGLALVSKLHPNLTESLAETMVREMFADDVYGMSVSVINEIHMAIINIYHEIMATSIANNDPTGAATMINYLESLPKT